MNEIEKPNQNELLVFSAEECEKIKPIISDFVDSYTAHVDMPVKKWLTGKMKHELPERSEQEVETMVDDIIESLQINEEKQQSLELAVANGRQKESWFANELEKAISDKPISEAVEYMNDLATTLENTNAEMIGTITTKSGTISMNPNLDGYIAEQFFSQTFNLKSVANGKTCIAKVIQPEGTYPANGVDLEILDKDVIKRCYQVKRRYQVKFGATAEATIRYIKEGDYRGQRIVVPTEQLDEVRKAFPKRIISDRIDYDGISSRPLTKADAQALRDEAQNGRFKEFNWSEYSAKDIASHVLLDLGLGKQLGYNSLKGAAMGVGWDVVVKLHKGEEVKFNDVVRVAFQSGKNSALNFALKAAVAGGVKVVTEKGIVKFIAKGTPAGRLADIAHVAIENAKILYKIGKGEITPELGLAKMEEVTFSTAAGLLVATAVTKGAAIGAAWGTVFGPIGQSIGAAVGGFIGYMGGTIIGQKVVEGSRVVKSKATSVVKSVANKAYETAGRIGQGIKSGVQSAGRAISSAWGSVKGFFSKG